MILLSVQYEVIASGSSGNAVLIDDVLVDVGVSFQKIKPHLKHVNYLLITHTHSDHLNRRTFNRIRTLYPKIVVIGNYEVAQTVSVDIIANDQYPIETLDYTFLPIEVPHDVVTYGYYWKSLDGKNILYCTDTSSLDNILDALPLTKFDYLFIESNHDERKIEMIREGSYSKYGYDAYGGAKRHLSVQQCKAFFYMKRRNKQAELIELHKSSRFY